MQMRISACLGQTVAWIREDSLYLVPEHLISTLHQGAKGRTSLHKKQPRKFRSRRGKPLLVEPHAYARPQFALLCQIAADWAKISYHSVHRKMTDLGSAALQHDVKSVLLFRKSLTR